MEAVMSNTNTVPNIGASLMALPRPVKAAHFTEAIMLGDGRRSKYLMMGMRIKVEHEEVVDCIDMRPTHEIIGIWTDENVTSVRIIARALANDNVIQIHLKP